MMDSWRRQKGEFRRQGTRSISRKASHWKLEAKVQSVPSWEKKFCFVVGSIPWRKLVETKRYMYLYENVVKWNDSAGEEAFQNAKQRFWAQMNGLPCDVSFPDADTYIDKIDWDSKMDEEVEEEESDGHKEEGVVIIGDPLLLNPSFSCVGWGAAEEDFKKKTDLSSGSGSRVKDGDRNPWQTQNDGTIKGQENDSWFVKNNSLNRVWGTWDRNREGGGLNLSRYKTTRYHGDEYQISRGGNRVNLSHQQPFFDKRLSRQCRPVSHGMSNKAGNSWGC